MEHQETHRWTVVAVAAAVIALVLTPLRPATADAWSLLDSTNAVRRSVGAPALQRVTDLDAVAQRWSQQMASDGRLRHNPDYSRQVSNWRSLAENVGYGATTAVVHDALVRSSGHYANIVNKRYTEIGIGVASGHGRVWVTQVFREPTRPGTPTAAPAPALKVGAHYKNAYNPTVYKLTDKGPVPVTYQQWAAAGFPAPRATPTDYVRYPWSSTVYGVTFWPGRWQWDRLSYAQWSAARHPHVRHAGWIEGSAVLATSGSPALYLRDPEGQRHRLTYAEWAATGFRPPTR